MGLDLLLPEVVSFGPRKWPSTFQNLKFIDGYGVAPLLTKGATDRNRWRGDDNKIDLKIYTLGMTSSPDYSL